MELREAAQFIRDNVGMQIILDMYGYQPKHGFMSCPFHSGDRTASLKVYSGDKGWHCYGCGRGGSVIDFVMESEDCDFRTAVKAIDSGLKLGLFDNNNPLDDGRRHARNQILDSLADLLLEQILDAEHDIEIRLRSSTRKTMSIDGKPKITRTAREWDQLAALEEDMLRDEDRKERLEELREEVRSWRREKRRAAARARTP